MIIIGLFANLLLSFSQFKIDGPLRETVEFHKILQTKIKDGKKIHLKFLKLF